MNRRYVVLFGQQGHPLANARGELLEHRAVLWEKIGPGSHPCHFCGELVRWSKRIPGHSVKGHLHTEHLDGDTTNNGAENLVPTCQGCNVSAGYRSDRIKDGEAVKVRPSGMVTRAGEQDCEQCGKAFLAEPSAHARFCSRRCANAAKVRSTCKRNHPRTPETVNQYGQCRECMKLTYKRYRERQKERGE